MILQTTVLIAFAYLLGSVPWGLVTTRCFSSVDILKQGSGNIGATNVRRLAGNHLGAITLAGDVFKGFIPVAIARIVFGSQSHWVWFLVCTVALAAFLGHLYPVYLGFKKGGKGVATAFGCFLAISFPACVASLLVFIVAVYLSDRVSAGSLAATAALPLAVWHLEASPVATFAAAIFFAMIAFRHRENIERLLRGTEPPLGKGKKSTP